MQIAALDLLKLWMGAQGADADAQLVIPPVLAAAANAHEAVRRAAVACLAEVQRTMPIAPTTPAKGAAAAGRARPLWPTLPQLYGSYARLLGTSRKHETLIRVDGPIVLTAPHTRARLPL